MQNYMQCTNKNDCILLSAQSIMCTVYVVHQSTYALDFSYTVYEDT